MYITRSFIFLRLSRFIYVLNNALLLSKSSKCGEFMMILIMGRSYNDIDWSSLFLFSKVDSFFFMVRFNKSLPLGLHIFSFHNLLKAMFWIKKASDEGLWGWFLREELCFSFISPKEAILLACFSSITFLSYSPFLLSNSMLMLKTTKKISKISGMFLISSLPYPVVDMIEAMVSHKEYNDFDSMMLRNLSIMKSYRSIWCLYANCLNSLIIELKISSKQNTFIRSSI